MGDGCEGQRLIYVAAIADTQPWLRNSLVSADAILLWTATGALAALISAAFAARYTYLTARLVTLQSQAKVIVFVRHDFDRPSMLCIRIANIGHDVARDIRFTASRRLPARAYGMESETAAAASEMTDGPLITGIPSLGPGDTRDITWGQFGGLAKALGDKPITLKFDYRSGLDKLTGVAVLEVKSYADTDASAKPAVASARALEKIATAASGLQAALEKIARSMTKAPDGSG